MSKNLTRKGIAFGAAFALGSTLLAGAPAFAAVELNLEPNAGTEYAMIAGETFTLKAFGNSEFLASNGSQLRVKVENKTAGTFSGFAINGTALDADYTTPTSGLGNSIVYAGTAGGSLGDDALAVSEGTQATLGTTAGNTAVMGLGASLDVASVTTSTSSMTAPFTFSFTSTTSADAESVDVTVWADADNDGSIDTGEITSPTRTVTFYELADVTTSVSVAPFVGQTQIDVSATTNVNEAQLTLTEVGFIVDTGTGTWASSLTPLTNDSQNGIYNSATTIKPALNSAKTAFTVTTEVADALTAGQVIRAGLSYLEGGTALAANKIGLPAVVYTTGIRATVANSKANVVASKDAKVTTDTSAGDVRLNSEFAVRFTAKDNAATPAGVSGVSTSAAVATSVSLSTTKYISVNGTDYKTASALSALSVAGTTDASGNSTVTIKTTGFAALDTVTVTFSAEGHTYTGVVATQQTSAYSLRPTTGVENTNDGYDPSIVVGGTIELSYLVADQFGFAPANGSYNVTLARAAQTGSTARTTAASWSLVAAVVDGKATFKVTDNGAGVGADTLTATLIGGSVSGSAQTSDLKYAVAADVAPAILTLSDNQVAASSKIRLNAKALPSWHYLATNGTAAPTTPASDYNFVVGATTGSADAALTLSGIVTNAANIGVEGVPVTLSAKGLTFKVTDGIGDIFAKDSITIVSGNGGAYSAKVFSDAKGGTVVVTATAGTLSKTTTLEFDQGAATGLAITAPSNSAAGRVVDVTVKVTDAAGQAVSGTSVTLKSTGAGYLNSQSGTTDATGEVISKLIVGVSETGTATVSVTATIDGVVTTKSVTITIGGVAGATVAASGSTGKFYVSATGAANRVVVVKVAGKFVKSFVPATADKKVVVYVTSAGNKAVTVFVGGKLALTKTVTVK